MYKKLTAKTQYLNPTLVDSAASFAKTLSIEPESDDALLKRGTIYTVFNVSGGSGYNTALITKVVHDVLHDSYFQSDNISPTQSLEKAISEVRDKIVHLTNESIHADTAPAEFSIIAGVLWGNVMYMVQYGVTQSYLVRGGEIKPINTVSEGTFSAASGVVKDGDVIIFCSQEFGKKYPPDKLLSMSIGEQELAPDEACALIKFIVDTTFSPSESIDFGLPELPRKKEAPKAMKYAGKMLAKIGSLRLPKLLPTRTTKTKPVESIGYPGDTGVKLRLRPDKPIGSIFGGQGLSKATKAWLWVVFIAAALAISISFTLKNRSQDSQNTTQESTAPAPVVDGAQTEIQAPDEEVFYDIKIADAEANPNGIAVFTNVVVVTDSESGKIFISDQTTAKFEAEQTNFAGIKNAVNIGGKLGFTDNEGYKVYDLAQKKVVESYTQAGLGVTSAYLNYVYSISGDKINRYSKSDDTLTEALWGQNESFSGARSMAVAFSIYIVTKDGVVEKYTGGSQDVFELSGLNNPTHVFADIDIENIYLTDSGNQRVAVFDTKGNFVKEYKPKKEGAWNDIRGLGVSPDEGVLFVLNGSRVYKTNIE